MATAIRPIPTAPTFSHMQCRVKDLQVESVKKKERSIVTAITVDGRKMVPSDRFWTSIFARYGFGSNIFKYYTHGEVFTRISEKVPNDKLRLCIETREGASALPNQKEDKHEVLLATSQPTTTIVKHDDLLQLLADNGVSLDRADYGNRGHVRSGNRPHLPLSLLPDGVANRNILTSSAGDGGARDMTQVPDLSYDNGVVRSMHTPANGSMFTILGDSFQNRFVLDTPIDGYGRPNIYLSLLREICTNSAIGYAKVFRSELSLGKKEENFDYAITRAMEGFNNEDGFAALQDRFEAAGKSWSSIAEINKVYKQLVRCHHKGQMRVAFMEGEGEGAKVYEDSPVIKSFHRICGDLTGAYGLANLDALGVKRQRTLPAGCKMYDLMNFCSEVATHYTSPEGSRMMQACIGDFLSNEFDLEGTVDKFQDWKDFLVLDAQAIDSYAAAQKAK